MRRHCNLLLRRDSLTLTVLAVLRRWMLPCLTVCALVSGTVLWQLRSVGQLREQVTTWREEARKADALKREIRAVQNEARRLRNEVAVIEMSARGWSPTGLLAGLVHAIEAADRQVTITGFSVTETPVSRTDGREKADRAAAIRHKLSLRGVASSSHALARFSATLREYPGVSEVVVERVVSTPAGTEFVLGAQF